MSIFIILIIIAPGILSTLYYLHITKNETVPPIKMIALCISFIYLTNMLPMFISMLKWYGEGLYVLGANAVWHKLQFCVKYMLLSLMFAILLPWIVALLASFKQDSLIKNVFKNYK